MKALQKLHELDAKLTETIELRSQEQERDTHYGRNAAVAAGVGVAGAGAYRYGKTFKDHYSAADNVSPFKTAMREVQRQAGGDVASAYTRSKKVGSGVVDAAKRAKNLKGNVAYGKSLGNASALKDEAKAIFKIAGRGFKLSDKQAADLIVHLDAKIDEIHASRKARKA
jgi:hypothetical protein